MITKLKNAAATLDECKHHVWAGAAALMSLFSAYAVVAPILELPKPNAYHTVHEYPEAMVWLLFLGLGYFARDSWKYHWQEAHK
jgi:hypothetical protein